MKHQKHYDKNLPQQPLSKIENGSETIASAGLQF